LNDQRNASAPDLRPIIARLQEIERKCRSLGTRNDEADEMANRLATVVGELTRDPEEDEPVAYGQLARQLFPAARMFESLGFMSVARELAHVESALQKLDPDDAHEETPSVESAARPLEPGATELTDEFDAAAESLESVRTGIPQPVGIALLALLLAVLASILILRLSDTRKQLQGGGGHDPAAVPTPTADVPRPSTAGAAGTPGSVVDENPTPHPRARLAQLIGEARLARQQGEIERSTSLLSQAARIDKGDTDVLDTARLLVNDLLHLSDRAAANAEWESAGRLLDRAREIAIRFELSVTEIDAAERRHASMVRYRRLLPDEVGALRAAVGQRVTVYTLAGNLHEGTIRSVTGDILELEMSTQVGKGGRMLHLEKIPLIRVREIRIFTD
jgi:hypothetical protein